MLLGEEPTIVQLNLKSQQILTRPRFAGTVGLLQGVTTRRRDSLNCFPIGIKSDNKMVKIFVCSFNVGTPGQDSQEQVSGQKYFRRVAAMGYRSRQSRSPGPGNSRKSNIIETPQRRKVLAQTFDPRYWAIATGACTEE